MEPEDVSHENFGVCCPLPGVAGRVRCARPGVASPRVRSSSGSGLYQDSSTVREA